MAAYFLEWEGELTLCVRVKRSGREDFILLLFILNTFLEAFPDGRYHISLENCFLVVLPG